MHDPQKTIDSKTLKRMQSEVEYREVQIRADAIDPEARTVNLAFSSEEPVERWFGTEILDHAPGSVRMDRLKNSAPLLLNHDSRQQIGVVTKASIGEDGVGRATVKLSRSALGEEILQDMQDGIRGKVSVGYRIHSATLEQKSDDGDTYRIDDWEPFEISTVAIPADDTVGVGRSHESKAIAAAKESAEAENTTGAVPESTRKKEVVMPEADNKTQTAPDQDALRKEGGAEALRLERERVNDITAIADRVGDSLKGADKMAREAINSGQGVEAFRADITEALIKASKDQRSPVLGLSDGEAGRFSFLRMLRAAATGKWDNAGFEHEVCMATAKRMPGKDGLLIPTDVLSRAVDSTVAAAGIQTDVLAQDFIQLLRNRMRVFKLGATVLGGLEGNVHIPRQSGAGTAYWVAEGGQPTEGDQAFDYVALSPKGVAAETIMTLQTIMQSSLDMEAFVRMDLAKILALAIDLAAINGSGASNQPTGILNTSGIGSVAMGANGAALTDFDPIVDLESQLTEVNADVGAMAYMTNAKVIGQMKKLKTTTGEYLWTKNSFPDYPDGTVGNINGYGVAVSNQVPDTLAKGTSGNVCSALLFGNWEDLVIGEWGALQILVDPYSQGVGNYKISFLQFVDMGLRHPESFAAITDILA